MPWQESSQPRLPGRPFPVSGDLRQQRRIRSSHGRRVVSRCVVSKQAGHHPYPLVRLQQRQKVPLGVALRDSRFRPTVTRVDVEADMVQTWRDVTPHCRFARLSQRYCQTCPGQLQQIEPRLDSPRCGKRQVLHRSRTEHNRCHFCRGCPRESTRSCTCSQRWRSVHSFVECMPFGETHTKRPRGASASCSRWLSAVRFDSGMPPQTSSSPIMIPTSFFD